jgi:hypothetical protein
MQEHFEPAQSAGAVHVDSPPPAAAQHWFPKLPHVHCGPPGSEVSHDRPAEHAFPLQQGSLELPQAHLLAALQTKFAPHCVPSQQA